MQRAIKEELAHVARVKALPCCLCLPHEQEEVTEVHHLVRGRRLGHSYVLPVCETHHYAIYHYPHLAQKLWEKLEMELGGTREWPKSKIVERA